MNGTCSMELYQLQVGDTAHVDGQSPLAVSAADRVEFYKQAYVKKYMILERTRMLQTGWQLYSAWCKECEKDGSDRSTEASLSKLHQALVKGSLLNGRGTVTSAATAAAAAATASATSTAAATATVYVHVHVCCVCVLCMCDAWRQMRFTMLQRVQVVC